MLDSNGSELCDPPATSQLGGVPDYRERLAYGTDQGRWLQQQVDAADGGTKRRSRAPSQRVFHEIEDVSLEPREHPKPQASTADLPTWAIIGAGTVTLLLILGILFAAFRGFSQ